MASISARERTGLSAQGVNFTEFIIHDESGQTPLIRVDDDFVGTLEQHILADLGGSGDSAAGFLLGIEERGALRVTGFQALATAGLQSLRSVVNEGPAGMGPAKSVGIYRAARQANHVISRDDLVRFREHFGTGRALFLQVRLFGGQAPTGVFYLGENGSLLSDRRSAEWPVNLRALGAEEGSAEPAANKAVSIERSRRWREFWRWLLGSATGAFAVTVFLSLWPLAHRQAPKEARGAVERAATAAERAAEANSPPVKVKARGKKADALPAAGQHAFNASQAGRPAGPPAQASRAPEAGGLGPAVHAAAIALPSRRAALNASGGAPAENASRPGQAAGNGIAETPAPPPAERPRVIPDPEDAALPPGDPSGIEFRPRVQVTPAVSPAILRQIQGSVMVGIRTEIDEAGNVISAAPVSAAGVQGQVAEAVADAVRRWQFEPARQGGRAVRGQTVLYFRYFNP